MNEWVLYLSIYLFLYLFIRYLFIFFSHLFSLSCFTFSHNLFYISYYVSISLSHYVPNLLLPVLQYYLFNIYAFTLYNPVI